MLFIHTWKTCTQTNHRSNPCQLEPQTTQSETKQITKKQAHKAYSQAQGTGVLLKPANKPARKEKDLNKVDMPAKWNHSLRPLIW